MVVVVASKDQGRRPVPAITAPNTPSTHAQFTLDGEVSQVVRITDLRSESGGTDRPWPHWS